MNYERRLQRLETTLGPPGCTCAGGPGLLIVTTDQSVPPPTVCPFHGPADRLVVKIQARHPALGPTVQTSARGNVGTVMPSAQVAVHLPPPAASTHPRTEETNHAPMG